MDRKALLNYILIRLSRGTELPAKLQGKDKVTVASFTNREQLAI